MSSGPAVTAGVKNFLVVYSSWPQEGGGRKSRKSQEGVPLPPLCPGAGGGLWPGWTTRDQVWKSPSPGAPALCGARACRAGPNTSLPLRPGSRCSQPGRNGWQEERCQGAGAGTADSFHPKQRGHPSRIFGFDSSVSSPHLCSSPTPTRQREAQGALPLAAGGVVWAEESRPGVVVPPRLSAQPCTVSLWGHLPLPGPEGVECALSEHWSKGSHLLPQDPQGESPEEKAGDAARQQMAASGQCVSLRGLPGGESA